MIRKLSFLALAFVSLWGAMNLMADSTTSRLGLTLPDIHSTGWGVKVSTNFVTIDSSVAVLGAANTYTGDNTFNGNVTISTLSLSQVKIASSAYSGTDKLAVNGQTTFFGSAGAVVRLCDQNATNCTNMNLETANPSKGIVVSTMTLNAIRWSDGTIQVSSPPALSGVILLQSTLQTGATFYVSSGTVNTLNVSTMTSKNMYINTSGGVSWIFGDQHSLFAGYGAGSTAGGFNNTGFGDFSMGFGDMTGSAQLNTAVGYTSLYHISSGSENTAIGEGSLFANTTASDNTGVGILALQYITTGIDNTALGAYAGEGDNITTNRQSVIDTSMTFVGFRSSRDSTVSTSTVLTNSVALGANAVVATSNTVVLGNSSITDTQLFGATALQSKTQAQIKALAPRVTGAYFYCTDCATVSTCVSTGTATGAWALITSKTSACQ